MAGRFVRGAPALGRRSFTAGAAPLPADTVPVVDLEPLLLPSDPARPCAARTRALESLGDACRAGGPGFFSVRVPPRVLPPSAVVAAYDASQRFFCGLDAASKARYHASLDARGRGWTPPGGEPSYEAGVPSLVEAFDLGRELRPGGSNGDPAMGPNVWPDDAAVPGFRSAVSGLYDRMSPVAQAIFGAFAESLGLAPDTFAKHAGENSRATMRLLRYAAAAEMAAARGGPTGLQGTGASAGDEDGCDGDGGVAGGPLGVEAVAAAIPEPGAVRAPPSLGITAHTDFECFTIMHQTAPGLQLLRRPSDGLGPDGCPPAWPGMSAPPGLRGTTDSPPPAAASASPPASASASPGTSSSPSAPTSPGAASDAARKDCRWVIAPPTPEGHLLVIVGDMLERWTNGYLVATPHRVVASPWPRLSLIRFNGVESGTLVAPLPQFGNPRYSPVTMGEHMDRVYAALNSGAGAQGTARWGAETAAELGAGIRSGTGAVGAAAAAARAQGGKGWVPYKYGYDNEGSRGT